MKFQMYVQVEVKDKNGKIQRIRKRKCSSYVRHMIDQLMVSMGYVNLSGVNTAGGSVTLAPGADEFRVDGPAGVTTKGIRVGTGTTPVAIGDYALATAIAEGTGAGQLSHGVTSTIAPTTVGSARQFTIARTFTNNSGASITVNEVALYRYSVTGSFMFERTLLTFSIANGASATVTYTLSVTV